MSVSGKKGNVAPPESAFQGKQLSLFQTFLCGSDEDRDRLSNTIELWDGVPKYFISKQEMNKRRNVDGFLPSVEKEFQYKDRLFSVKIIPARITGNNGKDKEFYPSAREELVEDALRKICAEQNYGFTQALDTGVVFSIYLLRQELKKRGHTMSYQQVIESLQILARSQIIITTQDGRAVVESPPITSLAAVSKEKYSKDPSAKWIAYFNPLVSQSIQKITYRQFDYHTMMSHRSQLARWLHKRLSHNYVQANYLSPYTFLFSSINRDSGLFNYQRLRDQIDYLDESLKELKEAKVILSVEREERKGARGKLIDVKYTLLPSIEFVTDIKAANKRQSMALEEIEKESQKTKSR